MSTPASPTERPRRTLKRESIVAAATQAFLTLGYGAASVDAISARAGVSKRTLYNYFPAKRDLFRAVVAGLYADWGDGGCEAPPLDQPPDQALPALARRLLAHLRRPEVQGLLRLVVAEHHRFPELALDFYAEGKGPAVAVVAAYLARQPGRRVEDPTLAAQMFLGAVKEALFWPILLGLPVTGDEERVIDAATAMIVPPQSI
jgi:TetR/AcrR family transcriptional regulator of autoinduction and epiphytic fitness